MAFEHLLEWELIGFTDSKGRCQAIEFRSVKLLISSRELHQGLKSISSCHDLEKLLLRFLAIQNQASRSTTSLDPNMSRSMVLGHPKSSKQVYNISGLWWQIVTLCNCKEDVKRKVHNVIDKFAERGLQSLAVARQEVPEKNKESSGGPWQFVGLLPLFDPPRHDSAETICRALDLGVNVKMITGRRLGMGPNMYPSSSLLGQHKDESISRLPVDELIEKADGFAGVFLEHKYVIMKKFQESKHIYGMTGDGVNDAPALKKADIGICCC